MAARYLGFRISIVRRNSLYGLLGFAVPTVVMLVAYPILVHHLGSAAFGIYILATSFTGALAILDFGFSVATLKFVAEDVAKGDRPAAARVILAALLFYGVLGTLCASVLWCLSPWLVTVFSIEPALRVDALWAFRLMALQTTVFLPTTVFASIFKGLQKFHLSTAILTSASVLTYGGAIIAVVLAQAGLVTVTAINLAVNVSLLIAVAVGSVRLCRSFGIEFWLARPTRATYRRMFAFGSVMTANSVSAVLLYQIQRYLVGLTMGPAAVTTYQMAIVAPSKVHAAVNAFTEVMLPISSGSSDLRALRRTYLRMLGASVLLAIVAFIPLVGFARSILSFWLGPVIAAQALPLLRVFALAYFFLALSPAPFHLLNGLGKPWINTVFYVVNATSNVALIGAFAWSGITLMKFAWAFAIANILTSFMFQGTVEILIWRRSLMLQPQVTGVAAE